MMTGTGVLSMEKLEKILASMFLSFLLNGNTLKTDLLERKSYSLWKRTKSTVWIFKAAVGKADNEWHPFPVCIAWCLLYNFLQTKPACFWEGLDLTWEYWLRYMLHCMFYIFLFTSFSSSFRKKNVYRHVTLHTLAIYPWKNILNFIFHTLLFYFSPFFSVTTFPLFFSPLHTKLNTSITHKITINSYNLKLCLNLKFHHTKNLRIPKRTNSSTIFCSKQNHVTIFFFWDLTLKKKRRKRSR